MVPEPADSDNFLDLAAIKQMQKSGLYAAQVAQVVPIKSDTPGPETEPLLSKNIRFVFQPNSSRLDLQNKLNLSALDDFSHLLQVSPGSTILLRGHADPSLIERFRAEGGEQLVHKVALTAMQLSKDRASEVAKLLTEKYRIDPSRIKTVGRGWEEPISDKPEENRRVELQWFTLQ
jgi:NitT/TauT family transport system substrate-binding protein